MSQTSNEYLYPPPSMLSPLWSRLRRAATVPVLCLLFLLPAAAPRACLAAGVTLITHGHNSNADDWVRAMADVLPGYDTFPGTNFTIYEITILPNGNSFTNDWSRTNGSPPALTDSGQIIVKLDWGQVQSGLAPPSTYLLADYVDSLLQRTNAIPDLGGHALAEFPLHLAGHSRGGSLINELSLRLGTSGLWVDHLTSLDPHPLNNDGNNDWPFTTEDAPAANTWANVLFRDNYWQDIGGFLVPIGHPADGAYNRELTSLSGGYSSPHSDVHLWYHGTLDWRTPTSDNTSSQITSTQRASWWVAYEQQGTNTGFCYSRLGGADRTSLEQPLGGGFPAIRDGYNQFWDLGGGTNVNRTALATNNGAWPSLIKLNRLSAEAVVQGQTTWVKFYYQWARSADTNATVCLYLDDDFNPLNTNHTLLHQMLVPGTGASSVGYANVNLAFVATNSAPGYHALCASITAGSRTRYLYAPELIELLPAPQPPTLGIGRLNPSELCIIVNAQLGQTILLQHSADLQSWLPLVTNTLTTSPLLYTNTPPPAPAQRFYRAFVLP